MEFNTFIVPAEGRTKYGKRQVSSSTTKGSTGGSGGGGGLPYLVDDSGNTVIQNRGNLISPNLFVGRDDISCYGAFSGTVSGISVIDNLTSTGTTDALSANQGRVLNATKQNTLISGTNIKTINNQSLLGSGNITIQGGSSGSTVSWNQTLSAGTQIAKITINGTEQNVYAPNGGSSYSAGTNIDITNNVISVTGITSFTGITKANVTTALGYTPLSAETFTSITKANVTTALGYTPLSAETFTSITSQNVVNALGYTPYNSSNPNHYITSATTVNNANKLGGYNAEYFVNTATTQSVGGNKTFTEQITGEKDIVCYGPFTGTVSGISVIDNLTSTATTQPLSANQGRVLNTNKQDKLYSGTNIKTINNQSLLGSGNITIQGGGTYTAGSNIDITNNVISVTGITSFTGITKANVTTALGYTPLSAETFTSITSQNVVNALGYTPYNSSNPNHYITGITKANVTTALGYTPLSAETFTSITSQNVVNALGYTPYNSSNPNHYITGITKANVTTALGYTPLSAETFTSITSQNVVNALGYTPYNSSNPNHYINSGATVNNSNKLGGHNAEYFVNTATTQNIGGNKTFSNNVIGYGDFISYSDTNIPENGHLFQFDSIDDITMSLEQFNNIKNGVITRATDINDSTMFYSIIGYYHGETFHHIYLQCGNFKKQLILYTDYEIGSDTWDINDDWSDD